MNNDKQQNQGLQKSLNPMSVWAIAFGCIIGWGSFINPGKKFLPNSGVAGTAIAMVLGALVMVIIAFSYAYMVPKYPKAGGEFTFTLDGSDAKKAINYVPFSVSISSDNPGATQTVWIAKTEDPLKNTYRNVILRLETPIAYGAGSLVYELTSGEFAK